MWELTAAEPFTVIRQNNLKESAKIYLEVVLKVKTNANRVTLN